MLRRARRLLVPGGRLIIQDRTPADIQVPGSPEHMRGYFFERFPRLLAIEIGRRPTDAAVRGALQAMGFSAIESVTLWEVRRTYDGREGLNRDLAARTKKNLGAVTGFGLLAKAEKKAEATLPTRECLQTDAHGQRVGARRSPLGQVVNLME